MANGNQAVCREFSISQFGFSSDENQGKTLVFHQSENSQANVFLLLKRHLYDFFSESSSSISPCGHVVHRRSNSKKASINQNENHSCLLIVFLILMVAALIGSDWENIFKVDRLLSDADRMLKRHIHSSSPASSDELEPLPKRARIFISSPTPPPDENREAEEIIVDEPIIPSVTITEERWETSFSH